MLFHGPPGTGKTSCIIAIAKQLYSPTTYRNMVLELNASDDRGINVVREQIKSFCSTQQLMSKGIKLVILDECDSMTSAAQFALRRIIEKYIKTTRFCLICNYVSKIIPALQSRCTRFRFGPLESTQVKQKTIEIAQAEALQIEDPAVNAIVRLSGGDMRKVLNIMESCALAHHDGITEQIVFDVTGRPSNQDVKELYEALTAARFDQALELFMLKKRTKSLALEDILGELHQQVMRTQISDQQKMYVVKRMAEIEHRLAQGCPEKPQIASLIGAFTEIRAIR